MMSNIMCRMSDLRWPKPACAGLDIAIVVALIFLAFLLARAKLRRWQCRTMQELRGAQRNGPAVLRPDGAWVYTVYFAFWRKVWIRPRPGYDLADIEEDLNSLSDALGRSERDRLVGVDAASGLMRFVGFRWVARLDETRHQVRAKHVLRADVARDEVPIGIDERGEVVSVKLSGGPLALILGGSGCGKSTLTRNIIDGAVERCRANVTVIDPHGTLNLTPSEGRLVVIDGGWSEWLAHFREMESEMTRRLRVLKERGVASGDQLPDQEMPLLVTVVDEALALFESSLGSNAKGASEEALAAAELQRIASRLVNQCRKARMVLVLVGQDAAQSAWSVRFVNATLFRACFSLSSPAASQTVLGTDTAFDPSLRHGRFILSDANGCRRVRTFQLPKNTSY